MLSKPLHSHPVLILTVLTSSNYQTHPVGINPRSQYHLSSPTRNNTPARNHTLDSGQLFGQTDNTSPPPLTTVVSSKWTSCPASVAWPLHPRHLTLDSNVLYLTRAAVTFLRCPYCRHTITSWKWPLIGCRGGEAEWCGMVKICRPATNKWPQFSARSRHLRYGKMCRPRYSQHV